MARLYLDEDVDQRLLPELQRLGHDVVSAKLDGRANRGVADDAVLSRATQLGRTVVTSDRLHDKRLHRLTAGEHAGIITVSQLGLPDAMAQRLHDRNAGLDHLDGQLIHIYRGD